MCVYIHCVHIGVCVYMSVYECVCACMCVYMCVCIHCVYVGVCLCMHVYTHCMYAITDSDRSPLTEGTEAFISCLAN